MIKNKKIKEWFFSNRDREQCEIAKILDVEYIHLILENNDDLYVTEYGLTVIEHLRPENFWTDKEWFNKNSARLPGTSCIYKIRTKKIAEKHIDIVIKWNRMGKDIPVTDEADELISAEFNSPFEEFSLVMELRNAMRNSNDKMKTQKPLAIYVPSERKELWQTGRKDYKMHAKMESHKEVVLDLFRSYSVIYEWIKGIDAAQALGKKIINSQEMELITLDSEKKIMEQGFIVRDRKPHHVIVRPEKNKKLKRDKNGEISRSLIDFELLERDVEREQMIKKAKRANYLKRQRDRFIIDDLPRFHPHLKHINILDVDYVYGHIESTKGRLWVVGKDPYLFDYFLPERWEQTPKTKLSEYHEIYHTVTKDDIHLVWKLSRVGLRPDMDPFKKDERKILDHGYNSPFEEVSLAVELAGKKIGAIYPRAIYMTGNETEIPSDLLDNSRYEIHEENKTPDGLPILRKNRDYIMIWGYWNGPDEKLAARDGDYYEAVDALQAYRKGILSQKDYFNLLKVTREKLLKVGIEDLNLRGSHILISFNSAGSLIRDNEKNPEIRICNFEFLNKF